MRKTPWCDSSVGVKWLVSCDWRTLTQLAVSFPAVGCRFSLHNSVGRNPVPDWNQTQGWWEGLFGQEGALLLPPMSLHSLTVKTYRHSIGKHKTSNFLWVWDILLLVQSSCPSTSKDGAFTLSTEMLPNGHGCFLQRFLAWLYQWVE